MKTLNIIHRYFPAIGGTETCCKNICNFLVQKGLVVDVATINLYDIAEFNWGASQKEKGVLLGPYDYDKGVFVRRYKIWLLWRSRVAYSFLSFILTRLRLERTEIGHIFKHSPHSLSMYHSLFRAVKNTDVVHLHTLPYFHNLVGYYLAKLFKKRIVITPYFHPCHRDYEKKIFYKIMNACDYVIAMSKYEKDYLVSKKIDPTKIIITGSTLLQERCNNGKPHETLKKRLLEKHRVSQGSKKILYLGRKEVYKGINFLIDASRRLVEEENMDISLFLAGPASLEFKKTYGTLKSYLDKFRLIDFGYVSEEEKEVLLDVCDVLVLPSRFESFGIVFLEAWKYAKPVIGTEIGAIPEVIDGAGLCVKHGDVEDLMAKIKTILNNKDLADRLGESGNKKLKELYSNRVIGEKIFNVYNVLRKNTKRVLIVTQLFPPHAIGGSEIVAYQQAKVLKKEGFDVRIFTGRINNTPEQYSFKREKKEFDVTSVNLHSVDFEHTRIASISKSKIEEIFMEDLYNVAPDIVHFHNIYAMSASMIDECRRMNIPVVVTLHDYWGICFRNILMDKDNRICTRSGLECFYCKDHLGMEDGSRISIDKRNSFIMRSYSSADLLISPSRYLAERFVERGLPASKVCVINNGIDIARFRDIKKIESKKIRFGYIGQIIRHKGIEKLIRSMSMLSDTEKKDISLSIVGTGEKLFFNYCKNLAAKLNISGFTKFRGPLDNREIAKVYREIDVLIVPSIWPENSPVTIMEALASKVPVLASDIGGMPELVHEGVTGYLHRYDDACSLTKSIRKIIGNPEVIKSMAESCFVIADRYNLQKQVRLIIDEYNKLIEN